MEDPTPLSDEALRGSLHQREGREVVRDLTELPLLKLGGSGRQLKARPKAPPGALSGPVLPLFLSPSAFSACIWTTGQVKLGRA